MNDVCDRLEPDGRPRPPRHSVRRGNTAMWGHGKAGLVRLLAVAIVGVAALAVDQQKRNSEERDVEQCAQAVGDAWNAASARQSSLYAYIRASLSNSPDPSLQDSLYGVLSQAATRSLPALLRAEESCAEVAIWRVHPALEERRQECLGVVRGHTRYMRSVTVDGSAAFTPNTTPSSC